MFALPHLFGTYLSSLWIPPFSPRALALIPLFLTKMQLSTLCRLTILCFGQTARFLSLLAKAAMAYLPTALSVALRPLFLFLLAQYALYIKCDISLKSTFLEDFSSFSAEACAILDALCWSRQHQQVCHFSLLRFSDYRSALATLSSTPFFLLPQSFWQELSFLYCSIRLQWVPKYSFLPGNDAADELARRRG